MTNEGGLVVFVVPVYVGPLPSPFTGVPPSKPSPAPQPAHRGEPKGGPKAFTYGENR